MDTHPLPAEQELLAVCNRRAPRKSYSNGPPLNSPYRQFTATARFLQTRSVEQSEVVPPQLEMEKAFCR